MNGNDILDRAAVAGYLGVTVGTLAVYRSRDYQDTFPEPDGKVAQSPWWYRDTIDTWNNTRPGKIGRPRSRNSG